MLPPAPCAGYTCRHLTNTAGPRRWRRRRRRCEQVLPTGRRPLAGHRLPGQQPSDGAPGVPVVFARPCPSTGIFPMSRLFLPRHRRRKRRDRTCVAPACWDSRTCSSSRAPPARVLWTVVRPAVSLNRPQKAVGRGGRGRTETGGGAVSPSKPLSLASCVRLATRPTRIVILSPRESG